VTRTCPICEQEFEPSNSLQKYCSQACGFRHGKGGPKRRGTTKRCVTCGARFYVRPGQVASRKFCSQACMGFQCRKERTCKICGAAFFSKPRQGPVKTCSKRCQHEAKRRRWSSQAEPACRVCGSATRLVLHHVVHEQHVRSRGGDIYDPTNSFTACWQCHWDHHNGIDHRIPVAALRPENHQFARALLGEYAPYYLLRYYDVPEAEAITFVDDYLGEAAT
jgi:5-methylcytosine-specific restriction endonuclease McrA